MKTQIRNVLGALAAMLVVSASAQATILPPNDLHLQDGYILQSGITEQQLTDLLNGIQQAYAPTVSALGGQLQITGKWADNTVNAQATQIGNAWKVEIFGGLVRRPEVSLDSVALVTCHELGHHLAGYSFVASMLPIPIPIPGLGDAWASNEGQSDYFSTHVCARKLWAGQKAKNATFRTSSKVPEIVRTQCETVYRDVDQQNLCLRMNAAGKELATLLGALRSTPQVPEFETPDTSEVTKTNDKHPAAQCRLDTYFAGSLCTAPWNAAKIPGRKHKDGQASAGAEREASEVSCMKVSGYDKGLRPTCWFKPML